MATFNFDVDTARLKRAMDTSDDIGAVVRIHFEIERALEHVISAMIPDAPVLKHRYMSDRIRFLLALGIPKVRTTPAKIINDIRNEFAHRAKEDISSSDVARLADSITNLLGQEIVDDFEILHTNTQQKWRYGEMSLKEQFCCLGFIALVKVASIENDFGKIRFAQS